MSHLRGDHNDLDHHGLVLPPSLYNLLQHQQQQPMTRGLPLQFDYSAVLGCPPPRTPVAPAPSLHHPPPPTQAPPPPPISLQQHQHRQRVPYTTDFYQGACSSSSGAGVGGTGIPIPDAVTASASASARLPMNLSPSQVNLSNINLLPPHLQPSNQQQQQLQQFLGHRQQQQPTFFQFPEQQVHALKHNRLRKPWWMWAIGAAEILLALYFSYRLIYNLATSNLAGKDRDTIMWELFLFMIFLAVQFMMGAALLIGLRSPDEDSLLWYCQSWMCGAYFQFGQNALLFLGVNKLDNSEPPAVIGGHLLTNLGLLLFRVMSYYLVRRFKGDLIRRKSLCHCPSPPIHMEVQSQNPSDLKKRPEEESTCGMTGAMVSILMA